MEDNLQKQENGLQVFQTPQEVMKTSVIGQNGSDLVEILKESIKKVQSDASYIPQAQAIRENIGQIIDLAKVEVQTMVAINNLNRG